MLDFYYGGCISKRGRIYNYNLWVGEWFLFEMYFIEMMVCCLQWLFGNKYNFVNIGGNSENLINLIYIFLSSGFCDNSLVIEKKKFILNYMYLF